MIYRQLTKRMELRWLLVPLSLCTTHAFGDTFEQFTYQVVDASAIEITDFPEDAVGHVVIPDKIEGKPVTKIGDSAFSGCSEVSSIKIPDGVERIGRAAFGGCAQLESITIPATVTSIGGHAEWVCGGDDAFARCSSLETIHVDTDNPKYLSIDGALFGTPFFANELSLLRCPEGRKGTYAIPPGITQIESGVGDSGWCVHRHSAFLNCSKLSKVIVPDSITHIPAIAFAGCHSLTEIVLPETLNGIGASAFAGCRSLARITIPGKVNYISSRAFGGCSSLLEAIFLGNAPPTFGGPGFGHKDPGGPVFGGSAPEFTIKYLSGSIGFTSPTWNGYPVVGIDVAARPAAPWLLTHGFPYDTNLHQNINGDDVSLLMAYALDLDSNSDLGSQLPVPVLGENELSMSFHASSPGITYTVETTTDLQTWTTDGVTLSDLDEENQRTASVSLDSKRRFLRLVVSEKP